MKTEYAEFATVEFANGTKLTALTHAEGRRFEARGEKVTYTSAKIEPTVASPVYSWGLKDSAKADYDELHGN